MQIFSELDKTLEVDQYHMIHAYAAESLQRPDSQRRTPEGECRIDLVPAVAGDIDVHIPRERDDVGLGPFRVEVDHHDRVAAPVALVTRIATVRAEQYVVQRALLQRFLRGTRGGFLGRQLDASIEVLGQAAIDGRGIKQTGADHSDK